MQRCGGQKAVLACERGEAQGGGAPRGGIAQFFRRWARPDALRPGKRAVASKGQRDRDRDRDSGGGH
eukprot:10093581-Alexandrium_andersonii.AAC.1